MSIISATKRFASARVMAQAELSKIDASYAALPRPLHTAGKSAGELVLAAKSTDTTGDPMPHLSAARTQVIQGLARAKESHRQIRKDASMFSDLADALDLGVEPPAGTPPDLAVYASQVLTGHRAGVVDRKPIAATLRRAAKEALARVESGERAFRRFESAANIASVKGRAEYLAAFGGGFQTASEALTRKAERLKHLHRLRFGSGRLDRSFERGGRK